MIFKRSHNQFGKTPQPVTPYQKAAQVWDKRMGDALAHARNWRFIAFGSLGLSLILSGGVIWQAGRSSIIPYIVELEENGKARAIKSALPEYQPSDAQIAYHLARFFEHVRSLPIDPIIVRKNWLSAYDYATAQAANTLNEYARDNDPFSRVGKQSIAIDVTSVTRASDNSFQIRWRERKHLNGTLASTEIWTALVSVIIQPPRNVESLRKNPLGIYVTSLNWSREFNSALTRNTPSAPLQMEDVPLVGQSSGEPSRNLPSDNAPSNKSVVPKDADPASRLEPRPVTPDQSEPSPPESSLPQSQTTLPNIGQSNPQASQGDRP